VNLILNSAASSWASLERKGELVFFLPFAQSNLESLLLGDEDASRFTTSAWWQIRPLTQGLSAIHEEFIVHGDLKPGNILVFRSGDIVTLKIADFGHSICDKLTAESTNFFADAGAYPLNPSYSPPELWNPGVINLRPCDVWALGCVLLELSVFLHGGSEDVQRFRKLRKSPVNHVIVATFHDTQQLKPQVREYLEQLELVPGYRQLFVGLRGMLCCDPSLRSTAAKACDDLRNIHEYHIPFSQDSLKQSDRQSDSRKARSKIQEDESLTAFQSSQISQDQHWAPSQAGEEGSNDDESGDSASVSFAIINHLVLGVHTKH
jgi:serine/threonine protein kinase